MTQPPNLLPFGWPLDAQRRLQAANQIGKPGTIARARAIDKAYRYIEDTYPQCLRMDNGGTTK